MRLKEKRAGIKKKRNERVLKICQNELGQVRIGRLRPGPLHRDGAKGTFAETKGKMKPQAKKMRNESDTDSHKEGQSSTYEKKRKKRAAKVGSMQKKN